MKKTAIFSVIIFSIILLSSFASAGFFSDLFEKLFGKKPFFSPDEPIPECGNEILEEGEICEIKEIQSPCQDGDYNSEALCKSDCSGYEECITIESCGDGIINGLELCDDGQLNGQPGSCNSECTEQSSPGVFDITECGILSAPGTYTLKNDIPSAAGDCFIITSDNVILDGNGFTITDDLIGQNLGVRAQGVSGITIKNLGIKLFSQKGIELKGVSDVNIIDNNIEGSFFYGISIANGPPFPIIISNKVIISGNKISGSQKGIIAVGEDITIQDNDACGNSISDIDCSFSGSMSGNVCDSLLNCPVSECELTCSPSPECGNEILEEGEICEINEIQSPCQDGDYNSEALCKSDCSGYEECITIESCGDGIINGLELCDDGQLNGQPGSCSILCDNIDIIITQNTPEFNDTEVPESNLNPINPGNLQKIPTKEKEVESSEKDEENLIPDEQIKLNTPQECQLTNLRWAAEHVFKNELVNIIVEGDNCEGLVLNLKIFEDDFIVDDSAKLNPNDIILLNGIAEASWKVEHQDIFGEAEYYFKANLLDDKKKSLKSKKLLTVSI